MPEIRVQLALGQSAQEVVFQDIRIGGRRGYLHLDFTDPIEQTFHHYILLSDWKLPLIPQQNIIPIPSRDQLIVQLGEEDLRARMISKEQPNAHLDLTDFVLLRPPWKTIQLKIPLQLEPSFLLPNIGEHGSPGIQKIQSEDPELAQFSWQTTRLPYFIPDSQGYGVVLLRQIDPAKRLRSYFDLLANRSQSANIEADPDHFYSFATLYTLLIGLEQTKTMQDFKLIVRSYCQLYDSPRFAKMLRSIFKDLPQVIVTAGHPGERERIVRLLMRRKVRAQLRQNIRNYISKELTKICYEEYKKLRNEFRLRPLELRLEDVTSKDDQLNWKLKLYQAPVTQ